jgi:hypothetical protein
MHQSLNDWHVVTTALAPLWLLRLHARFYKSLGAKSVLYFIDSPERYTPTEICQIRQELEVVFCDAQYWERHGGRPVFNAERQCCNLSVARASRAQDAWILHVDIDEFLFVKDESFFDLKVPYEVSEIRIQNAERVLCVGQKEWPKGYLRVRLDSDVLARKHYGASSNFFGFGLSNYFHGKSFVRNKPRINQGVHGAIPKESGRELVSYQVPQEAALLVHYPCITPSQFAFRYRSLGKDVPHRREFLHERLFRQSLLEEAERSSLREALTRGIRDLHFCDADQASARIKDGLYRILPQELLDRMGSSASEPYHLHLNWADENLSNFLSG